MSSSSSYVDLYHRSRIQKGSYDNNLGYIGGYRNIILIQPVTVRVWPISIQYVQFNFPTREMVRNMTICVYSLCHHVSSDVCINWKMRMKALPEIKGFVYDNNGR